MTDKSRLTLTLSRSLNDTLDRIADDMGTTKADVFRRAIALLMICREEEKNGNIIGIANKGRLETQIVIVK
jgi:predicted transcriptional regulator